MQVDLHNGRETVMLVIVFFGFAWWIKLARGVVVNFDLGEQFPRPRSQQQGSLRPAHGM